MSIASPTGNEAFFSTPHALIKAAQDFASEVHGTQVRKYTGEPYTVHTTAVAELVSVAGLDTETIMAAHLHDVLEDTDTTYQDLLDRFGSRVARLVWQVTDQSKPSDGNRAKRKEIDRQHLAGASYEGKSIKLADLIDNTASIVRYDPDFAQIYLREKERLLEVLEGGNQTLLQAAQEALASAQQEMLTKALGAKCPSSSSQP